MGGFLLQLFILFRREVEGKMLASMFFLRFFFFLGRKREMSLAFKITAIQ